MRFIQFSGAAHESKNASRLALPGALPSILQAQAHLVYPRSILISLEIASIAF
eukprot:IDg17059t1